ncbi:MAG TPA: hypothetical protein VGL81_18640 [Polyangiaceae bacterium]
MTALDLAIAPLDAARRGTLRLATRSTLVTRLLARRDTRLALLATAQVAVGFALAVMAPVVLFAVAPVLLGVVHVGADVRYLVLRRRLPRGVLVLSACAAAALLTLRLLSMLHVTHVRTVPWEVAVGAAWIGGAFALGARHAASRRRVAVGAAVLLSIGAAALAYPATAYLVFFHGHNLIAVLVWLVLFRRNRAWAIAPIAAIAVGLAAVLSGAFLPWIDRAHAGSALGLHLSQLSVWLAPGLPHRLAMSVVVAFVFLQAVHYSAWLGWVPQDALPGEGTFTFRMTARSLVADFGKAGLALIVVLAVALGVGACFGLHEARGWYLGLSNFHGWLECALLGYFVVRGERLEGARREHLSTSPGPR